MVTKDEIPDEVFTAAREVFLASVGMPGLTVPGAFDGGVAAAIQKWEELKEAAAKEKAVEKLGPSYRAFIGENPCDDPSCPCHPKFGGPTK